MALILPLILCLCLPAENACIGLGAGERSYVRGWAYMVQCPIEETKKNDEGALGM